MLTANSIVLYKNLPAIVKECGEKYTIAFSVKSGKKTETKTQTVREKDVVVLFPNSSDVSDCERLYEAERKISEQKSRLDDSTNEVYQLFEADENQNPVDFSELCELVYGSFTAVESRALYSYFHTSPFFKEDLSGGQISYSLRSRDEIDSLIAKQIEKSNEQENRAAFISRLKSKKIQLPDDAKYMQEIEAFALGKTDKSKNMKDAGYSETQENAHKLLIDTKFWTPYKNPYPARAGLSMQSAGETLSHPPVEERIHIQHVALAIDNEWSRDPDDAVFYDGTFLWIHIADPASTVLPDTKIDLAARNRGATLYVPECTARMLSEDSLEDYALGLVEEKNPEAYSKALSFRLSLDENGTITDTTVQKTEVRVRRLTYEQADEMCTDPELAPLFSIAEKNIERRKKAGAVFILLPEVHISVSDEKDAVLPKITVDPLKENKSAVMVREMMLLAGEGAAKFAFKNQIPIPFISQDSPDLPKDLPSGLAGQYRLRRSMRARSVGTVPSAHAGLGVGMYTQVTSPLRRYSDLLTHQQLRAFIDKKPLLSTEQVLERISAGDAAAGVVSKVQRKSELHWILCFLLQNPDWTGDGVVVELKGNVAVVLIPSLGQETQIALKAKKELNSEIRLKAGKVDIAKQTVTFVQITD